MDLILPLWATVAIASAAGAWTYAIIRPYRDGWLPAISSVSCGTIMGVFFSYSICEYMGWNSIHQHHAVAFAVGLLGMIMARAAVALTETEAGQIAKRTLKRLLGLPDDEGK